MVGISCVNLCKQNIFLANVSGVGISIISKDIIRYGKESAGWTGHVEGNSIAVHIAITREGTVHQRSVVDGRLQQQLLSQGIVCREKAAIFTDVCLEQMRESRICRIEVQRRTLRTASL